MGVAATPAEKARPTLDGDAGSRTRTNPEERGALVVRGGRHHLVDV